MLAIIIGLSVICTVYFAIGLVYHNRLKRQFFIKLSMHFNEIINKAGLQDYSDYLSSWNKKEGEFFSRLVGASEKQRVVDALLSIQAEKFFDAEKRVNVLRGKKNNNFSNPLLKKKFYRLDIEILYTDLKTQKDLLYAVKDVFWELHKVARWLGYKTFPEYKNYLALKF